jgi:signal peptidase I
VSTVVLGLLAFFFCNFQTVVVSGKSMLPTLHDHQRILICKALWLVGAPKHNDIVVVRSPESGELLVKRVYRLGGELVDDLIYSPKGWNVFENGPYQVKPGTMYLIGDNVGNSEDSRVFGPVNLSAIVGKMVAQ